MRKPPWMGSNCFCFSWMLPRLRHHQDWWTKGPWAGSMRPMMPWSTLHGRSAVRWVSTWRSEKVGTRGTGGRVLGTLAAPAPRSAPGWPKPSASRGPGGCAKPGTRTRRATARRRSPERAPRRGPAPAGRLRPGSHDLGRTWLLRTSKHTTTTLRDPGSLTRMAARGPQGTARGEEGRHDTLRDVVLPDARRHSRAALAERGRPGDRSAARPVRGASARRTVDPD